MTSPTTDGRPPPTIEKKKQLRALYTYLTSRWQMSQHQYPDWGLHKQFQCFRELPVLPLLMGTVVEHRLWLAANEDTLVSGSEQLRGSQGDWLACWAKANSTELTPAALS